MRGNSKITTSLQQASISFYFHRFLTQYLHLKFDLEDIHKSANGVENHFVLDNLEKNLWTKDVIPSLKQVHNLL